VKAFYAKDIKEFKEALVQAKESTKSTLIQVDVDPDSMSNGYGASWRVDSIK
jgi:TPP-dependent trihydroxycyclohexane-1,2-dione (THcHDO) dehydratase